MEGADKAGDGSGDRACTAIQTEVSELHHEDHCEPLEKHESQGARWLGLCTFTDLSGSTCSRRQRGGRENTCEAISVREQVRTSTRYGQESCRNRPQESCREAVSDRSGQSPGYGEYERQGDATACIPIKDRLAAQERE